MKMVAYLLILAGVIALGDAVVEQIDGHAKATSPVRSIRVNDALRRTDPEGFRNLMAYQWIRAATVLGAGAILLAWVRKQDRLNPFSVP